MYSSTCTLSHYLHVHTATLLARAYGLNAHRSMLESLPHSPTACPPACWMRLTRPLLTLPPSTISTTSMVSAVCHSVVHCSVLLRCWFGVQGGRFLTMTHGGATRQRCTEVLPGSTCH